MAESQGENQLQTSLPVEKQTSGSNLLRQIRTYQGDVAQALSSQRESMVSIQRAEYAKRGNTAQVTKRSSSPLFFIAAIVLIVLAGGASYLAYNQFEKQTTPPTLALPQSRFISAESSQDLLITDLSREQIFAAITEASTEAKIGGLKHLVLRSNMGSTTPLTSVSSFLQRIGSSAPGNLIRAFEPIFMLGNYQMASNTGSRFLIIKLTSYSNAFAGMLAWEPNMAADLSGLFANNEELKQTSSQSVFKDVVWKNKDVRVLYNASSTPILLYSLFDNQALIITDSLTTLETLLDRLTREKLSR